MVKTIYIQSLDVIAYERNVYTFLNWLGDVGALFSVISVAASIVLLRVLHLDLNWKNFIINNVFSRRVGVEPN